MCKCKEPDRGKIARGPKVDCCFISLLTTISDLMDLFEIQLNAIKCLATQSMGFIGNLGLCHVILPFAEVLLNFVIYRTMVFFQHSLLLMQYELIFDFCK